MGGFSMQTKLFGCAAMLAALFGWTGSVLAQYGQASGSYGPSAPYGISQMSSALGGLASFQPPAPEPEGAPGTIGCSDACGQGDCCCDCCCPGWCHRINIFGEFLYLRARNAEIAYAVPVDGGLPPAGFGGTLQVGPVATLDPDWEPAYRVGAGFTLNETTAIVASYTNYESRTLDQVQTPGGGPATGVFPLVLNPFPVAAGALPLDAFGLMDLNFRHIDVDYKGLIAYNCDYKVNYVVGVRYTELEQLLAVRYEPIAIQLGANVLSNVDFEGAGLKLGMEGEYYGVNSQWFAYGKGYASLIGGEFRTTYQSGFDIDAQVVNTSMNVGRLVGIYDIEVGAGWRNHCDNIRISAGYTYSIWTNVMKNNEWINAVQQNNFVDQSDNFNGLLTFDGFTVKAELLW
jgi:hypothetical protein